MKTGNAQRTFSLLILTLFVTVAKTDFTTNCMKCICRVEGCESQIGKCRMDVGSLSCGPYQIKNNYWIDCYQPGGNWQTCTKQMPCSETCVEAYMRRYGTYCTQGRTPTCKDYAKIHNGGPKGCRRISDDYWLKVKRCCDETSEGCDTGNNEAREREVLDVEGDGDKSQFLYGKRFQQKNAHNIHNNYIPRNGKK